MAKRPDSPAGARFRDWLVKTFGSIQKGAEVFEQSTSALNRYFKGNSELGKEWARRIEENGGDYYYILTGRKTDIHSITRDEKGEIDVDVLQEEDVFKISGLTAEDAVVKTRTLAGRDLLITVYRKMPVVKTAEKFSRIAEPEFTEEQKPPMPIPIADKKAEILQPPQIFTIRAVASPKQPPSGIEFEKGQEP